MLLKVYDFLVDVTPLARNPTLVLFSQKNNRTVNSTFISHKFFTIVIVHDEKNLLKKKTNTSILQLSGSILSHLIKELQPMVGPRGPGKRML